MERILGKERMGGRMTEKRYYVNSDCYLCDMDLSNTLSIFECADLLNELSKENEKLKHELHTLTGLYAFDKMGDGVKATSEEITVPRKDLIKLDYGDVE